MTFIHGIHVEKYNISMFFSHFSKILFFGVSSGVKGQKMAQNLRKHTSYDCDFCIHLKNDDISRCFYHFLRMLIFWVVRVQKGKKMTNLYLYSSRTVDHIIKIFSTQV